MKNAKTFSFKFKTVFSTLMTVGVLLTQSNTASAQRHVTILEFDIPKPSKKEDPRKIENAVATESFSADGLFDFDKSTLKNLTYLHSDFERLTNMAKNENLHIRVDAFADEIGSESYNMKLSQQRAKNVADYLVYGFDISPSNISYRGWGEQYPVVTCDTSKATMQNSALRKKAIECLKPNRRVTISLVK